MAIRQLFNYLFNYFAQVNLRQLKRILLPFAGFIITLSLILFANHHTAPPAQSQVTVASINKSFLPIAIDPGGVSRLSISIFNGSIPSLR